LLRRHWRLSVRLAAIILPVLALVGIGLWHLYLIDALTLWFAGLVGLGLLTGLATFNWQGKSAAHNAAPMASPTKGWSPLEQQAWSDLREQFDAIEAQPPATLEDAKTLALTLVETIAQRLHPDAAVPAARFTVPDVLRAAERGLADLRGQMERLVPGANAVRVSDLMYLYRLYGRHGGWLRAAWAVWRMARASMDPVKAGFQELNGLLQGQSQQAAWHHVHGQFARLVAEELARLAIDLYGRRFSVDMDVLEHQVQHAAPEVAATVPVRVSLMGQVNAGKSSLVNALLGEVKAPVSERRTSAGAAEFRLKNEGRPDLVLVDMPGLDASAEAKALADWATAHAWSMDLLVWVVSAVQPARQDDHQALAALRAVWAGQPGRCPPNVVFVVTQVDRLSPMREWQPPYALEGRLTAKATSIRDACLAVRSDLCTGDEPVVPMALRPGMPSDNVEALWMVVSEGLDHARQSAQHRALAGRTRFNWGDIARQVGQGTLFLGRVFFSGAKR
jgi:GTP-binding protein EngB required for normal cell division